MTAHTDSPLQLYPKYCFHLSPTIGQFCHFRICDVFALASHPGYEGQQVFFYINHPIKWVRIAGVVVAVDEFEGKRVYTIDDSSGDTIECVANVPIPLKPGQKPKDERESEKEHPLPKVDGDVDVGHVIDIKGSVRAFRNTKQIHADKISHLRSTDQEVQFWEKAVKLRKEILGQPWVLTDRDVRRCRKDAGVQDRPRRTGLEKKSHASSRAASSSASNPVTGVAPLEATSKSSHRARKSESEAVPDNRHPRVVAIARAEAHVPLLPKPPRPRETGLERKPKKKPALTVPVTGNYDALGL